MQRNASYTLENVAFRPRETELAWTLAFPADAVFTAVEQAARRHGLRPAMASREHGLIIAKPPLSPLNIGRKVVFSLTSLSPARTLLKAQYLHGAVILQSREARLDLLDTVLRTALSALDMELDIRSGRAPQAQPAPRPAQPQPMKPQPPRPQAPDPAPAPPPADAAAPAPDADGLRARAREAGMPPPAAPAHEIPRPDLKDLDFGHLDWNDIPLEPPSPEDRERYHRAAGSGRLSMTAKLLWLALGMGIFFGLALLAGMLGP